MMCKKVLGAWKGTRDEVSDQHSYCFNVEDEPKTFDEAMKCQDVAFWKEAINDEIDSIMDNTTWVLDDLLLVIKGFRQKSGIYYFDIYALVAHISTIRLPIALASIHNLIIHLMDAKTAFLNGELDKETPKQWYLMFDEVVLSNGYLLNQADKYVYSKFDESGKEVIICLYVDDILIFGTNQVQVNLTKEFLSSRFSMKDMRDADVILVVSQLEYSRVIGYLMYVMTYTRPQLEYSRVIGCLMYVMTCTRPDIAFVVGKLSRYTSNPDNSSTSGWVFLLGGGVISWASKKQTCITSLTMESEFVALAAAGKEVE
nr:hypothetical protein [Tanacetum cinerariifolium]